MNELGRRIEIGQTLSAASETLSKHPVTFLTMTLMSGVFLAIADAYLGPTITAAGNIAAMIVGVIATLRALQIRCGSDIAMNANIGRAFGASLLKTIAILIGFVFLIVPGVLLLMRWALVLPALILEDLRIREAMERSANLSKGSRWQILGLSLIVSVPVVVIAVLMGVLFGALVGNGADRSLFLKVSLNLLGTLPMVLNAIVFVESYLTLSGQRDRPGAMADIFA